MATRTATPGLSTDELARIRDTLAAGRKPKVVFTAAAGQIAGQVGQVIELTDPALSDEWVVVRFGHDELPFSPTDLAVPVKASARRPVTPAQSTPAQSTPAQSRPAPPTPLPSPREEPVVPSPTTAAANGAARPAKAAKAVGASPPPAAKATAGAAAKAAPAAKAAAEKAPAEMPAAAKPAGAAPPVSEQPAPPAESPAPKPARKAAKPKPPPSLTVTLTYADGEWMVGATQGSKALAKPYVIKPSEALKMVSMLDVPGVHDAVDEIVSAARSEAERQAERLRVELAEVESRLAELREAG
jgi:hypothetical protein